MFACGGLELYFHGQEGLAAIFSPFAAILEKFSFFVLGPLVGPLCSDHGNPAIVSNKHAGLLCGSLHHVIVIKTSSSHN